MKLSLHSPEPAGIYIHWPFCARKCPYCDFFTFGREHPEFERSKTYLHALLAEIESAAERFTFDRTPEADTIYFGGGTPSLMEPEELAAVIDAIKASFKIIEGAEITMEVNPTAAEIERLGPAREAGVNRLSVGCQSFNDTFLKYLGRDHDAAMAHRALETIRDVGFDNVSVDLMFGLPEQTLDDFARDLRQALEHEPDHLSAYHLTLHEGTPYKRWHGQGRWALPGHEIEASMFELLIDRLAEARYEHYEISNWSRPGRQSRHNSKYWRRCDVYGFGASAHGVVNGARYANPRDLALYASGPADFWRDGKTWEDPPETERAKAGEIMMLALRRVSGAPIDEIAEWMGRDPEEFYAGELEEIRREGLIHADRATLKLTRRGVMFADDVMARFF